MSVELRRAALVVALLTGTALVAQAPAPPTEVTGRLLDPALRPIVGARLGLRAAGAAGTDTAMLTEPVATTGDDGVFRFGIGGGDEPRPSLVVVASGWATFEIRAPRGDLGDLLMVRGASVVGSVRDVGGQPLGDVEVTASDALLEVAPLRRVAQGRALHVVTARSDERGLIRLDGTLDTALRIEFRKPGHATLSVAPYAFGDPLVAEMEPVGALRGRVLDADGRPVRAELSVRHDDGTRGFTARSAADGGFEVGLAARAPSRIFGWAEVDGVRQTVDDGPFDGAVEGLVLTLEPPRPPAADDRPHLSVQAVAAETGVPLQVFRAGVVWNAYAANQPFDALWRQVQGRIVDAVEGLAAVEVPGPGQPSTGVLVVGGPGRSWTVVSDGVVWSPEQPGGPIRVELPPESVVRGRVVDPTSAAPIPDARVGWVGASPTTGYRTRTVDRLAGSPSEARTGPDGSFELRGFPAGRGQILVACDGRPDAGPVAFELAEGEVRGGVDVEVPAGATLRGALVGFGGEPGYRVAVRAIGVGRGVSVPAVPRPEAGVGTDGRFTVPALADGFYALELVVPRPLRGGLAQRVPIDVFRVRAGADRELEVDVSGDLPGRLEVRAVVTGAALARTRLALVAEPEAASPWVSPTSANGPLAVVGGDGRVELRLAPGSYRIRAFDVATGVELQRASGVVIRAGESSELLLVVEVGVVEVRIARAADTEPLRRLEVQLDWPQPDGRGAGAVFKYAHDTGVGVDLGDGRSKCLLVLPPFPVRLRVWAGPAVEGEKDEDAADKPAGKPAALLEQELQVEVGGRIEVELVVPGRPW